MNKLTYLVKSMLLGVVLLFLNSNKTFSQTIVPGGTVSGIWAKAGSPYQVQGSIMVPTDSMLTIEPGVQVEFQGVYKLLILGRVIAAGTVTDTISFIPSDTATGWRGIRFENTSSLNDSSKFYYCKFLYGKATGTEKDADGGAIYIENFSNLSIQNCYFKKCHAYSFGGAIACLTSANPRISNNTFINNSSVYQGGAIYSINSSPLILNNTITNNSSSGGGGIYLDSGNPEINGNDITYNLAYTGAGIYSKYSDVKIINNNISFNSSNGGGDGGGIYSTFGIITIENNTLSFNSAFNGGGIHCYYGGEVIKNIISNNSAVKGGGIYYYSGGAAPVTMNNTLTNNTATSGGGIYCEFSSPALVNNTISNNSATNGGGIFCTYQSTPNIKNSIFWGNTSSNNGSQVYLDDEASDPDFYYCDVAGGFVAFGVNGNFFTGAFQNNINADPLFANPSSGSGVNFDGLTAQWALQSNSPCIDSGTPDVTGLNLPVTDLNNLSRITVCRIDIGAYEYPTGMPLTLELFQTDTIRCYSSATGGIFAYTEGGTTPYSYSWSHGATNSTAGGLSSGLYKITVTESSGCAVTDSFFVGQPAPLMAFITPGGTLTLCDGDTVTLTATAANSYSWTTGDSSQSVVADVSGNYAVTITDLNGCAGSSDLTPVTVNPLPSKPTITASGNILSSSMGIGFQWFRDGVLLPGENSTTYTTTQNGNYSVCVTDLNGCSSCSDPYNFILIGIKECDNTHTPVLFYTTERKIIVLKVSKNSFSEFRIFDVTGKMVYLTQNSESAVPVANFSNGLYFYKIDFQNKLPITGKMVIQ